MCQAFIDAAEQAQDTQGALLLAELQSWWEPSWEHLHSMQRLCSPQKFSLRRQQLQALALNDGSCRFAACSCLIQLGARRRRGFGPKLPGATRLRPNSGDFSNLSIFS